MKLKSSLNNSISQTSRTTGQEANDLSNDLQKPKLVAKYDRNEKDASARDHVRGAAPMLLLIDEHGDEKLLAVKQSRM